MTRLFSLFIFLSFNAYSFVISKTENGNDIKWRQANKNILIYANPANSGGKVSSIASSTIMEILHESINQWNSVSPYKLLVQETTNFPSQDVNLNRFSFSSNPSLFSSGVLAVTSVGYDSSTGTILSGEVIVNDSISNNLSFSSNKSDTNSIKAYLGDILTHEIGHFLGLSHSEVVGASMVYSVFKGQHSLHHDDVAGIDHNYGITKTGENIKGRVIGGNQKPIFGTHVSLISSTSGAISQSQITNELGEFNFKNLDANDSYYIHTAPIKNLTSLPRFYSTVRDEFCNQNSYKESFFTSCGGRGKGRPQLIRPDRLYNSNVGDITIRCDENLDPTYLSEKFSANKEEYELISDLGDSSFVFNGYFLNSEIEAGLTGSGDLFKIDLSSLDINHLNLSQNKLIIKLSTSNVGASFDPILYIKRNDEVTWSKYESSLDSIGLRVVNLDIQRDLSTNSGDNVFEIKVFAKELSFSDEMALFAIPSILASENASYIISGAVGSLENGRIYPLSSNDFDSYPYSDNALCTEAQAAGSIDAYRSVAGDVSIQSEENLTGVTCGSIDIDNDSNNTGLGSFVIGFLLIILISSREKLSFKFLSNS